MTARTLVLFNRDLRVADHPALHAAARAAEGGGVVVPLFVLCPRMLARAGPNRRAYLRAALLDLDASLQARGTRLWAAVGEPAAEAGRIAAAMQANAIHVSADYSALARRREDALGDCAQRFGARFEAFPGVAAVAPGAVRPTGAGAFQVFTPYLNRWLAEPLRQPLPSPRQIPGPDALPALTLTEAFQLAGLDGAGASPGIPAGGETAARVRMSAWLRRGVNDYEVLRDVLPRDATSRLSADLHFGCISPAQLRWGARDRAAASAWVRQLCWRDFYLQALAAFPALPRQPFQPRARAADVESRWLAQREDAGYLAWCEGRTGLPVVDAAMHQLRAEGFIHNRARMLVASYLTRRLGVDWRLGLAHFDHWLVDGDLAVNAGNWQWAAGTGHDRRPNRTFNFQRQALRFDPDGDYVRRYLPALRAVAGAAVHQVSTLTGEAGAANAAGPTVQSDASGNTWQSALDLD